MKIEKRIMLNQDEWSSCTIERLLELYLEYKFPNELKEYIINNRLESENEFELIISIKKDIDDIETRLNER